MFLDCWIGSIKQSKSNFKDHDSQSVLQVNIADWALNFVKEGSDVCDGLAGPVQRVITSPQIWKPPAEGIYKVNTDAALDGGNNIVGFGISIRNSDGLIMACSSQKVAASFSPQMAEPTAIHRGLLLALEAGLSPCILGSDAEIVVKWINKDEKIYSDIDNIIYDINLLMIQANCKSILFVPRLANQVAHVLAKNSLSCVENLFWLEDCPPCVDSLITAEYRVRL